MKQIFKFSEEYLTDLNKKFEEKDDLFVNLESKYVIFSKDKLDYLFSTFTEKENSMNIYQ